MSRRDGLSRAEEREAWTSFIEGRAPDYTRPSKYGNVRTEFNGRVYASQREASYAAVFQQMEQRGQIRNLEYQVGYTLVEGDGRIRPIRYVADFRYETPDGRAHIIDVKGFSKDKVYRLKKKLMQLLLGITIEEI